MASSFSRARSELLRLAALFLVACGREDIELAPPKSTPVVVEDCSAEVPEGLLAARPPMGWNGYNTFGECSAELDEAKVRATADALVANGMQSAGYQYVNLDACWQLERDVHGVRTFDPVRLPGGIEALASDVHERGLSLGVWSAIQDCRGEPGGIGYETVDAATYAAWGIDYVKYVSCGASDVNETSVSDLAAALAGSGRPTVLSVAAPPFREWMRESAQASRTATPIEATFTSVIASIDATEPLAAYARPGAFLDPDMLEIGVAALTPGEERVHFSVWSILSAPLIAGNDLTTMTDETLSVLTNSRLIAVDQDPLGLQGALIRREGDVDVLAKPLADCGARAVVLWNRGEASASVAVTWEELWLQHEPATVQDLWSDTPLDTDQAGFTVSVPAHDAVALRVTGVEPARPRGHVYLSDVRFTYATNGFGPVELDTTNGEDAALDGQPIRLRGRAYDKGLGVHGPSLLRYRLGRACTRFAADIGIDDDQAGAGSVEFEVWADGERLFQSGVLTGTSPPREISKDVTGRRELRLFVGVGGDSNSLDHGVWAGARLECDPSGAPTP